jgi:hypothetical protein
MEYGVWRQFIAESCGIVVAAGGEVLAVLFGTGFYGHVDEDSAYVVFLGADKAELDRLAPELAFKFLQESVGVYANGLIGLIPAAVHTDG